MTQEQVPETKSTTPQTSSEEKSETHEQKAELTLDQKAQEVTKRLEKLSKTIKPDEKGNIFLTAEQLRELDRIDSLVAPPQALSLQIPKKYQDYLTREDLLDPASIKAARKRIEKRLKAEKKSGKELDKLLTSYEKLLNEQNSNNYKLRKASVL